jgi:acyl-CoA synthetase (AMP-forming)/AMP-acid ligase II
MCFLIAWPWSMAIIARNLCAILRTLFAVGRCAATRGRRVRRCCRNLDPQYPAQAEAHFGVPACGAVLNTINTRLDVDTVSYIFDHGEAKVVLADSQFIGLVQQAIDAMSGPKPLVIEVVDTPQDSSHRASSKHTKISSPKAVPILNGTCPKTNGKVWR